MSEPAAFRAIYSNFKTIPSRKCVQITLEAHIEAGDSIIRILGMPNPETSRWLAVAVLEHEEPKKEPLEERLKNDPAEYLTAG